LNSKPNRRTRYAQLIECVFFDNYKKGETEVEFDRVELSDAADRLGIVLPKNIGDAIYTVRYRTPMPEKIRATAPHDKEWIIEGAGRGRYRFRCVSLAQIEPASNLAETKVLDATPGLIERYALSDEQALLAVLRYNRLVDVFLGITCYSLQNHLRTTVPNVGQVETDEVYVGLDKRGAHYVIPVQAKGGTDKLSTVQIAQDFGLCANLFPDLLALPLAAQFMGDRLIALFSFELHNGQPVVLTEKHYRLCYTDELSDEELASYRSRPLD
jgi:hypothetical protein